MEWENTAEGLGCGDHVRSDGCYGGEMEWENTAEGWAVGTM